MKIKLFAALLLLSAAACNTEEKNAYTVKGSVKSTPATTIYLEEVTPTAQQPVIVDSATIKGNGDFELSTLAKGEALYSLRLSNNRYPFASFINDTESITINADFGQPQDPYSVKGSPASAALKDYLSNISTRLDALQQIAYPADTAAYKKPQRDSIRQVVANQIAMQRKSLKDYTANFIGNSNNATLALYAISSYQSIAANPAFGVEPFTDAELRTLVDNAAKKFPQSASLATVQQSLLEQPQKVSINSAAPDFTLPDPTGKPVSLSSFKGQWVLVDFWASWCPPCRAENPNLVAAYNQHKDKNFTILGVSLDRTKEEWLKGIEQDGLTWTHVSDLAFWNSKVVPLYGFNAIPYNVLLNPQGIVVAENLTGAALQQKLAEVLK